MIRFWILVSISLVLVPHVSTAQDFTPHGRVVNVRGQTLEVRMDDAFDVPEGTAGTVYTENKVGGVEQQVPVAKVTVASAQGSVVTGRVTNELAGIDPDIGFKVSFSTVRVSSGSSRSPVHLGALALTSVPPAAQVSVRALRATATGRTIYRDRQSLGRTPLVDSLMPGRYRVTLRADGYEATRTRLFVYPDSATTDTVRLQRTTGTLVVEARPDTARISIDGVEEGRGRVASEVEVGEHTVAVSAPGHHSRTKTLALRAGQRRTLDLEMKRRLGTLRVTSLPDSARVTIGGTDVGRAPVAVKRPPGRYDVRVRAPHYKSSTHRVAVRTDEETTVRAELQRPIQVDLAGSHGPGVRNPTIHREGEAMVIQYGLSGEADEYDVTLRLSDERGTSYPTVLYSVEGDVGDDVAAGTDRRVRWAVLDSYPRGLVGENYRLRIATDPDGGNAFLYVLGSILTGGGATAAVLMLGGGSSGNGGGSSTGDTGGIPTPPSPPD